MQPDILILLSDQHAGSRAGFAGDPVVRTPNLDRIAATGIVFENAYTSCPLCVPARMSFLSGHLPSATGVYDNAGSLPSDTSTFLHSLGAEGYETVLCGRMHFEGPDQRHGFMKRVAGDITPLYVGDRVAFNMNGGYSATLTELGCLRVIGGGNSPTLEYDRSVVASALDYLSRDHERPQCVVVGTYAPHFPYVAPPELYEYYLERVRIPEAALRSGDFEHPLYAGRTQDASAETVRRALAAYCGMIEFMDVGVGAVYDAWTAYLSRRGRKGVFAYLSDHGDQVGERALYGKKTFFESSARIPLMLAGDGVRPGIRVRAPVSIMDIGPTLCDLTGAEAPPDQDGVSLAGALNGAGPEGGVSADRIVIAEAMERNPSDGTPVPGRMVRSGRWKYVSYAGFEESDLLFDLDADPCELRNVAAAHPDTARALRAAASDEWEPQAITRRFEARERHLRIQRRWIAHADPDRSENWKPTPAALRLPDTYYASPVPLKPHLKKILDSLITQENKK